MTAKFLRHIFGEFNTNRAHGRQKKQQKQWLIYLMCLRRSKRKYYSVSVSEMGCIFGRIDVCRSAMPFVLTFTFTDVVSSKKNTSNTGLLPFSYQTILHYKELLIRLKTSVTLPFVCASQSVIDRYHKPKWFLLKWWFSS